MQKVKEPFSKSKAIKKTCKHYRIYNMCWEQAKISLGFSVDSILSTEKCRCIWCGKVFPFLVVEKMDKVYRGDEPVNSGNQSSVTYYSAYENVISEDFFQMIEEEIHPKVYYKISDEEIQYEDGTIVNRGE